MKEIEERAKKYADDYVVGDVAIIVDLIHNVAEESYIAGATEQKKIDIDKACEWFSQYLFEIGYPDDWCRDSKVMRPNGEQRFRRAMEGISENKKEVPSNSRGMSNDEAINILTHWADGLWMDEHGITNGNFDIAVDIACKALNPSNSCNYNKNLQELTWGDIQCILDIAEGVKEDISLKKLMDMDPVDYCVEILKRFREENDGGEV